MTRPAEDHIAKRLRISGRVQDVFFRDSTRAKAHAHGARGWVRNCADDTVEAHFEGAPDAVTALVAWCHSGPRRARVTDVLVTDVEPEGHAGFEIR